MRREVKERLRALKAEGTEPALRVKTIRCSGRLHRISWRDGGAITLHHHSKENLKAMSVARSLGAECPCLDILALARGPEGKEKVVPRELVAAEKVAREIRRRRAWSKEKRGVTAATLADSACREARLGNAKRALRARLVASINSSVRPVGEALTGMAAAVSRSRVKSDPLGYGEGRFSFAIQSDDTVSAYRAATDDKVAVYEKETSGYCSRTIQLTAVVSLSYKRMLDRGLNVVRLKTDTPDIFGARPSGVDRRALSSLGMRVLEETGRDKAKVLVTYARKIRSGFGDEVFETVAQKFAVVDAVRIEKGVWEAEWTEEKELTSN